MAQLITIARPYAEAIFALGKEEGKLTEWSEELMNLALITQDSSMQTLLASPEVSAEQILSVYEGAMGEQLSTQGKNLLKTMAQSDRLMALKEVSSIFETLRAVEQKQIRATVISARKPTIEHKKKLSAALNAKFDAEVEIEYEVDEDLISGVKIKVGDWVVDGSARTQLNKLGAAIAQ